MVKTTFLVFLCGIFCAYGNGASVDDPRIIGGSTAAKGGYPHMVSMRYKKEHICGGSIIDSTTILTAGHCLLRLEVAEIYVVVGTNTLNAGGVTHSVSQAVWHTKFNPLSGHYDIAILKLTEPITFNKLVAPIKLASSQTLPKTATLSGWGVTKFPGSAQPSNDLQHINLKVIDLKTCAELNKTPRTLTLGNICTLSPAGQGACRFDSGSPLIANGEQIGVVSWGDPCALGNPDVFTSVAAYKDFITQHKGDSL